MRAPVPTVAPANVIPFSPRPPTAMPAIGLPPLPAPQPMVTSLSTRRSGSSAVLAIAATAEAEFEPATDRVPPPEHVVAAAPVAAPTHHAAPAANTNSPWGVYEQLGLGPRPIKDSVSPETAKFLVNAYRALGFAVLTIIVIVLVGYIATSAFYFVSDSWVQPMRVAASDERVLSLQSQLTEQENTKDKIIADLNHADRYIAVQQTYQGEFAAAIRADLTGRKAALNRVRELASGYASARDRVRRSNQAYAAASQKKMAEEYAAGLIDRGQMLSGKFQLAQITSSNLTLAERQAEYEDRATDLEAEAQALNAILDEKGGTSALSYDVLKIKQEYELSRLETQKAIESREALKSSLERQEKVVDGLKQSPYLRAVDGNANVAFVPYSNMDDVRAGAPLYGCALEMLFCRKVGKIVEVMQGEVSFKHPHREKVLRGRMIVVDLKDKSAAEDDVLFVGGRPLLL
ncbi:MAG TPA: hypothetical protein VM261_29975 [Kofleriaceae bacterium]|nr:hypothetical protein [Kofleriaceae bacterium]